MVQESSVRNFLPKVESGPAINAELNVEKNSSNYLENNIEVEKNSIGSDDGNLLGISLPPIVVSTPVDDSQPVAINTTVISNDTPLVAGDDDLIEKEWVEKAKKIVSETHDDPYAQDEAVSKLQADYIDKRYGRKLGSS